MDSRLIAIRAVEGLEDLELHGKEFLLGKGCQTALNIRVYRIGTVLVNFGCEMQGNTSKHLKLSGQSVSRIKIVNQNFNTNFICFRRKLQSFNAKVLEPVGQFQKHFRFNFVIQRQ